jgi:hypothetical protein
MFAAVRRHELLGALGCDEWHLLVASGSVALTKQSRAPDLQPRLAIHIPVSVRCSMPVDKSAGALLFPTRGLRRVWAFYILVVGVSCSGGGGTRGSGGVAGSGGAMGSGGILASGIGGSSRRRGLRSPGEAGVSAGGTAVAEWARTVVPPGTGSELEFPSVRSDGQHLRVWQPLGTRHGRFW